MNFLDYLDSLITYIKLWWIGIELKRLDVELQNLEYFIEINSREKKSDD